MYIQYAEAGDQYVGRVLVAGLPVLDAKYACSPVYFYIDANINLKDNTCTAADVDYVVQRFFPAFVALSVSFKPIAIHCAAAVLFAKDYFNANMCEIKMQDDTCIILLIHVANTLQSNSRTTLCNVLICFYLIYKCISVVCLGAHVYSGLTKL